MFEMHMLLIASLASSMEVLDGTLLFIMLKVSRTAIHPRDNGRGLSVPLIAIKMLGEIHEKEISGLVPGRLTWWSSYERSATLSHRSKSLLRVDFANTPLENNSPLRPGSSLMTNDFDNVVSASRRMNKWQVQLVASLLEQ